MMQGLTEGCLNKVWASEPKKLNLEAMRELALWMRCQVRLAQRRDPAKKAPGLGLRV